VQQLESFPSVPFTQVPDGNERRQLRVARLRVSPFPVVYGLCGDAD